MSLGHYNGNATGYRKWEELLPLPSYKIHNFKPILRKLSWCSVTLRWFDTRRRKFYVLYNLYISLLIILSQTVKVKNKSEGVKSSQRPYETHILSPTINISISKHCSEVGQPVKFRYRTPTFHYKSSHHLCPL